MSLRSSLDYARQACLNINAIPLTLTRTNKTLNTRTGGYTTTTEILPMQKCRIARPSYRVLHPLRDMANNNGMLYDWIVMFDNINANIRVGDSFLNPLSNHKCQVSVVERIGLEGGVGAIYAMAIEVRE